jgi:hypothetical protein
MFPKNVKKDSMVSDAIEPLREETLKTSMSFGDIGLTSKVSLTCNWSHESISLALPALDILL